MKRAVLYLILAASVAINGWQWSVKVKDNERISEDGVRIANADAANQTLAVALYVTTIQRDACRNHVYRSAAIDQ